MFNYKLYSCLIVSHTISFSGNLGINLINDPTTVVFSLAPSCLLGTVQDSGIYTVLCLGQ